MPVKCQNRNQIFYVIIIDIVFVPNVPIKGTSSGVLVDITLMVIDLTAKSEFLKSERTACHIFLQKPLDKFSLL